MPKNPVTMGHLYALGIGVVATSIFCFGYPGWFMKKSTAAAEMQMQVSAVHANYCLDAYLETPGITAKEIKDLKSKATDAQADFLVEKQFAATKDIGRACGKQLDRTTEAQIDEAVKKAMATPPTTPKAGG